MKKITMLVSTLLVFGCMSWAADKSFVGVISDSHCGAKHAEASDKAAGCVGKCVSGGAKYALVSQGKVYQLDPQDKVSSDLAGKSVSVKGTLSGDTITISSVEPHTAAKKATKKENKEG